MSLASRHSGATQGSNHAAGGNTKAAGAGKSTKRGGAFVNLLSMGRISVPRQLQVQARNALDNAPVPIHLSFTGTIGQGTFGQIEKATLTTPPPPARDEKSASSGESTEPKTVLQVRLIVFKCI